MNLRAMSSSFRASSLSAAASSASGTSGRRRAWLDEPVQRRESFAPRQGQPRALKRAIAEVEPHRPWLGDLLDLVEVARGAVPIADSAAESGAGEEAAGRSSLSPRSA